MACWQILDNSDNVKHSSLLRYGTNYVRKKFYAIASTSKNVSIDFQEKEKQLEIN